MQPRTRVFLTLFIVLALIAGLYIFTDWFSKATGYVLGEDQKIKFITCLNDNHSTLYLTENCADCEKQVTKLGETPYNLINKITCDVDLCNGLQSVPAWEIEGKFYYGVKEFKELDDISTSCNIN